MKRRLHNSAFVALAMVLSASVAIAQQPMPMDAPSVLSGPAPANGAPADGAAGPGAYYPGAEAYGDGAVPGGEGGYGEYPNYDGYGSGEYGYGDGYQGEWPGRRRRHLFSSYYGGFEGLVWWNKGRYVPALATTSDPADEGVLGRDSTTVLFGRDHIGGEAQMGGRLTLGGWIDQGATFGIAGRLTVMEGDRTRYDSASNGTEVISRPFFNVGLAAEDALLVSAPGFSSGNMSVEAENDFHTGEILGRMLLSGDCMNRIDVLGGYQFARLDDSLRIESDTTITDPGSALVGTQFLAVDRFATKNEFHGGVIGLMGEKRHGRAKVSWISKIAIGSMHRETDIRGGTTVNLGGGGTVPLTGGLFTQGTNIGTYERSCLAIIPEATINLHYQLTHRLDVSFGYSIIYLDNVALAGDQIDRAVNLSQQGGTLAGSAHPLPTNRHTDFWFQGINFGVNYAF
jgi:hypothetical protein